NFAVLNVTNDAFVVLDLFQHLTPANETPPRSEIVAQSFVQPPQGARFAPGIGGQPDVGHAAAVDELLQLVWAEWPGLGGVNLARLFQQVQHVGYLPRL